MKMLARVGVAFATLLLGVSAAHAEPGMPVGVRWWGGDTVSVETYWNLSVSISGSPGDARDADLSIVLSDLPEDAGAGYYSALGGELDISLDRPVNAENVTAENVTIEPTDPAVIASPYDLAGNTIRVRSFAGDALWVLVQGDGVSILYTNDEGASSIPDEITTEIASIDVLVLPIGVKDPGALIAGASARMLVPIGFRSPKGREFKAFEERLGSAAGRQDAAGNTTAVSTNLQTGAPGLEVLRSRPWRAKGKLGVLLKNIDRKNRKSQSVFAPLSPNQMNHKPSNGAHAPRWNVEHMTGTELAFFTRVYSNLDPDVPAIQRFPAQQPPDYTPAHPEWTGGEEARRMERVLALRNRFAYLLDSVDLDTLPRGAPAFTGSLEGMCERVAGHYDEHTAHVLKKFKLDDWPED